MKTMKKTDVEQVLVNTDQAEQRIDNFLLRYLGNTPSSRIYKMLRRGEVRVNKGRVKHTYRLNVGDKIRIPPLYLQDKKQPPDAPVYLVEKLLNAIVYQDSSVLVLNKPAGLAVHGGSGHRSGIIEILRSVDDEHEKLELVHRLDKEASGCLLLARSLLDVRLLHNYMKQGMIHRSYKALLAGRLQKKHFRVDMPLLRNASRSGERLVKIDSEGKEAITVFYRRRICVNSTLADIDLVTGRTHQIRVHSAFLGHPVVGDRKYGNKWINTTFKKLGLKRLFLHARELKFISPATNRETVVNAPMGIELSSIIDKISRDK